jgi:uncharacterized membrane protein
METIHPMIVHFPIALLLTATLISVLAIIFKNKREELKIVLYWILILGAVSVLAALFSGLYEDERVIHDEVIHKIMEVHKRLGFVIASAFVLITLWFIIRKRKIQFRELLIITLLLIGTSSVLVYSAYLGGKMVYEEGAGVKPMEKLIMKMPGGSLYHHEGGIIHNAGEQVEHKHPEMEKDANSPRDSTDSHKYFH